MITGLVDLEDGYSLVSGDSSGSVVLWDYINAVAV
jgi:hypothetical protein